MTLAESLENSFVAGVVLVAPLVVTLFVLRVLVNWSLALVNPIVRGTRLTQYTANDQLAAQVVAAVLIVAGVTSLGFLAQRAVGRHLFGRAGRVVNLVPLVNTIYTSVRQVANSLVERNSRYESVVLVEYPREGLYSIGLVTGEGPDAVEPVTGDAVTVYLPNSPNPTGGRLAVVPEEQVHEIDMSVRHGLRLVVTTGIGAEDVDPSLLPGADGPEGPTPAGTGRPD